MIRERGETLPPFFNMERICTYDEGNGLVEVLAMVDKGEGEALKALGDIKLISEEVESLFGELAEHDPARIERARMQEEAGGRRVVESLQAQLKEWKTREREQGEVILTLKRKMEQLKETIHQERVKGGGPSTPPVEVIMIENKGPEMLKAVKERLVKLVYETPSSSVVRIDCGGILMGLETNIKMVELFYQQLKSHSERWRYTMWHFLSGREHAEMNVEILRRLEEIDEQLREYSAKFTEVKGAIAEQQSINESAQNHLTEVKKIQEEINKIETYYEEEIQSLKQQIDHFKEREGELEREITLLHDQQQSAPKQSARELELESEIEALKSRIKQQSNKKNDLYNQMKSQKKAEVPQVNPEFDEYGNIPLPSDSKKTMFNPQKYFR